MRPAPPRTSLAAPSAPAGYRRAHAITTILALAILPTLAWALWPSSSPDIPSVREPESVTPSSVASVAFDADAFGTPIWVAAPAPPAPPEPEREPPPPPPPEPLKVQLLSIVRDGDTRLAMLFDPDTRKVLTLAIGDHVGAATDKRTITSITDRDVIVTSPRGEQVFSLRDPGSSPSATTKPRRRP